MFSVVALQCTLHGATYKILHYTLQKVKQKAKSIPKMLGRSKALLLVFHVSKWNKKRFAINNVLSYPIGISLNFRTICVIFVTSLLNVFWMGTNFCDLCVICIFQLSLATLCRHFISLKLKSVNPFGTLMSLLCGILVYNVENVRKCALMMKWQFGNPKVVCFFLDLMKVLMRWSLTASWYSWRIRENSVTEWSL